MPARYWSNWPTNAAALTTSPSPSPASALTSHSLFDCGLRIANFRLRAIRVRQLTQIKMQKDKLPESQVSNRKPEIRNPQSAFRIGRNLLIATSNAGKVVEIASSLDAPPDGLNCGVIGLGDL